ncbi:hypothetical protein [Novosphingobium sp. Fuku2-ISO-50]|uniref:hypothetical protein n=1 Tax=Novosphingobium sp. Fuku2-ISO-50 TaxID=1739114 RepID=UPI00076D8EA3|nr:hypothetical protein [Novosphingobium sp. Fuku2-ISO-50]KUR78455.1 hypothetical protein AQZ50_08035 [Novosphingobium sp. Fuku2-ISO-50]
MASKDITQLAQRIAAQHGWAAAKAFKAYAMTDADRAVLSQCALDLLAIFPPAAGSSALISAALAVSLERRMTAPIHVVAGTLSVEGVPIFGDGQPFDGAHIFSPSAPDWDGHVWIMIGPHIVDMAIFRTAYSAQGPARLARHVDLTFGPGKGLYVDHWKKTPRVGLHYDPHYVLSADEVTRLMGDAFAVIKQARAV